MALGVEKTWYYPEGREKARHTRRICAVKSCNGTLVSSSTSHLRLGENLGGVGSPFPSLSAWGWEAVVLGFGEEVVPCSFGGWGCAAASVPLDPCTYLLLLLGRYPEVGEKDSLVNQLGEIPVKNGDTDFFFKL